MQIRIQGKQVQLIRSPYCKEKKRCVQKVAHTFKDPIIFSSDDVNTYLSAEQVADLSDDEKKTLSDWLREKADKCSAADRRFFISWADKNIIKSADAILSDGVDAEQAAKIWEAIERLSKALKKSGHPKSASRAPAAPVPPVAEPETAQQADLPLDQPSSSLPPGESA